ncbi:MAG TPA: 1,4-dihydroxy-2-naphthoate polyprenyltransferase [Thermoanaerobaculia bacterium]|nr:1,4-dihydroxy-2-naphthoate polyprenyltransferase [Thermoanaerobaculia bacterium]
MRNWILASRPKTLTAAVIPVLVGTVLAASESGRVIWLWSLLALAGAILIQIGTNLINDALDFEKGTDRADRLGPQRVTASGLIDAPRVKIGGWIAFALAALTGVPLILRGGVPLLIIGVASIIAGYLYTGGPYPLAYHGLGEIFVILFFGVVAVGGTYYLQTLSLNVSAIVSGLAVGLLSTVLLAVNNLRDMEDDQLTHKRTMAVRFGRRFAVLEIAVCALTPLALGLWWLARGEWIAAVLPLALVPLAVSIVRSARQDRGAILNRTLGKAAALHAGYGVLFSIGLLA